MDHVVLMPVLRDVLERVSLNECERVVLLELDVHTRHIEACAVVANRSAACSGEEVQELHSAPSARMVCQAFSLRSWYVCSDNCSLRISAYSARTSLVRISSACSVRTR